MLIQNANSSANMPTGLTASGGPVGVAVQAVRAEPPSKQTTAQQQPTPAQLSQEVNRINTALQRANKNLELSISVDGATNKQVVKLTDKDTGDTILQYPSEAVLAIAQGIDDFQQGLLLKQQA